MNDPDDRWTASPPPQLERLLAGNGAVTVGLTPTGSSASSSSVRLQTWVRRRRWVRVMRRRLDIPPLPFLQPDGAMYHLAEDGTLMPYVDDNLSDSPEYEGQELGSMSSTLLASAQDYVARARYLVGNYSQDEQARGAILSPMEVRRAIAKLERGTTELRQGLLGKSSDFIIKADHDRCCYR